jgi:kinesin family protein 5
MSNANSIKVVARFRPQNRVEIESGGQPIVSFDGQDTCTIDVSRPEGLGPPFCRVVPRVT